MPGMSRETLVRVVADSIALPGIGLQLPDRAVDALHPAILSRRDGIVREHALGAGLAVHALAGLEHLLLRDEPILGNFRGRIREQRYLGVAVEEDFLEVVVELEVVDVLWLFRQLLVSPA